MQSHTLEVHLDNVCQTILYVLRVRQCQSFAKVKVCDISCFSLMYKASYLVIVGIRLVWHDLFLMHAKWLLLFSYYPLDAYKFMSYLIQYFCVTVASAKSVHLLQFPETFKDKHCIFSFQEFKTTRKKKSWSFSFLELKQLFYKKTLKFPKICFIGVIRFIRVYEKYVSAFSYWVRW